MKKMQRVFISIGGRRDYALWPSIFCGYLVWGKCLLLYTTSLLFVKFPSFAPALSHAVSAHVLTVVLSFSDDLFFSVVSDATDRHGRLLPSMSTLYRRDCAECSLTSCTISANFSGGRSTANLDSCAGAGDRMAAEMAAAVSTAVLNGSVALVEVMMAKVLGDAVARRW